MGNKPIIFLLFLLSTSACLPVGTALAQINQVDRFELEQKGTDASWTIISMKEQGIALVRDKSRFLNSEKIFEIRVLDSLLKEVAYTEVGVPVRMTLIGYEYSNEYLYILLRSGDNEVASVLMLEYNLKTKDVERYDIKHDFNLRITHFTVLERHAILAGYVGREPAVIIYDILDSQLKVVPGFFLADTELLDVRINENGTFNTLMTNRSSRQDKTLTLRTFDKKGVQLMEDEIKIDQGKTILSGLTSSLVRDEMLIAGTYAVNNSKIATGFFSVLADPFKEQQIHYYDFGQLTHFLDYLSAKRAEKIKAASQRFRDKSKEPEFKTNVSNVRLEERSAGFYLLAEAYSTVTAGNMGPYPYGGYGSPYYTPYSAYGYSPFASRYYNSPYNFYNQASRSDYAMLSTSVLAFNPDGKLEWDHSLKADDQRKPALEQVADFWCDKNKIVIATKSESDLVVRARFRNNESEEDTVKVLLKKPTDVVREETNGEGGVRHWYGNKFYVWGYQTVKDPEMRFENRTRDVFYLIKVNAY
ncbi:MAG: hypothetical protein WDO14_03615 [Bacteroidota bacterium]